MSRGGETWRSGSTVHGIGLVVSCSFLSSLLLPLLLFPCRRSALICAKRLWAGLGSVATGGRPAPVAWVVVEAAQLPIVDASGAYSYGSAGSSTCAPAAPAALASAFATGEDLQYRTAGSQPHTASADIRALKVFKSTGSRPDPCSDRQSPEL